MQITKEYISNTEPIEIDESLDDNYSKLNNSKQYCDIYLTPRPKNALEYFRILLYNTMYKEAKPYNFNLINSKLRNNIDLEASTINLGEGSAYKKFKIYNDENIYKRFDKIPRNIYKEEEDFNTDKKRIEYGKEICKCDLKEGIQNYELNKNIDNDSVNKENNNEININLNKFSFSSNLRNDEFNTNSKGNNDSKDNLSFIYNNSYL